MQTFTAPLNTNYKIECWGASGGNCNVSTFQAYPSITYGGKGGYCLGKVTLPYSFCLYIYVGQSGEGIDRVKTFNGGGAGGSKYQGKSGGGATDIRLVSGTWNNFNSLKSRIIVAAGGGGADHYYIGSNGGYAGGLFGQDGFKAYGQHTNGQYSVATGATQISGGTGTQSNNCGYDGTFGIGGDCNDENHGSGGGSGYYGGGGGGHDSEVVGTGAGGSSFISGYSGCDAIDESSTEDHIIHTGQPNHYSGYVFSNSVMIDGGSVMPSPSGGTETGHSGNGYCIITWQQLP